MAQRIMQYQAVMQLAQQAPQIYDLPILHRQMIEVLGVKNAEKLVPIDDDMTPRDPISENMAFLNGEPTKAFIYQDHDAHIATHLMMGLSPILQSSPTSAAELQKHILDHIRLRAEEDMEVELFKQYGTDPDRMVSAIQREGMVAINIAMGMKEVRDMQETFAGGEGPDPLVQIKEKEIAQRAEADKARIGLDQQRLALDQQKAQQTNQINQQKLLLQQEKVSQPQQPGGQYAA
jgi:hypothetical protein